MRRRPPRGEKNTSKRESAPACHTHTHICMFFRVKCPLEVTLRHSDLLQGVRASVVSSHWHVLIECTDKGAGFV